MKVSLEYTDTFGGEANYDWVRRTDLTPDDVDLRDKRAVVRWARAWAGLTGVRCERDAWHDTISLRPRGMCTVLFITWDWD